MFIFGFITITNIHQTAFRQIRLGSITLINEVQIRTGRLHRSKKTDHYLLLTLLIQVIFLTLFSLPPAIENLYTNATRFQMKNPLQTAINNFFLNLFLLLTCVTNGMLFYIYTLSGGSIFRKALFDSIRYLIQKITCRQR